MAEVWADQYFGQGDKVKLLVALALADCANSDTGLAWPALENLAAKSRTSVRGAQEAIREMENDGKLEIQVAKGPRGTNLYLFTPRTECTPPSDLHLRPPQTAHPARRAPRKQAAEKAAEFPPEKAALDCTQSIRNHQEPSKTEGTSSPVGESEHSKFIRVWTEEYPNHHGGENYVFQGGKDGAHVKTLLASGVGIEKLIKIAIAAWKLPLDFDCKSAASISGFASKLNDIRNRLNALQGQKNGSHSINENLRPPVAVMPDFSKK